MKKNVKKIIAIASVLAFSSFTSNIPENTYSKVFSTVSVSAASEIKQCYLINNANQTVYVSRSCTGTKVGTAYGSDILNVYEVHDDACYIGYQTTKGEKKGWIPTSTILLGTGGSTAKSTGRFTVYKRASTSSGSFGAVYGNDTTKIIGERNGMIQLKYPTSNGYKYAWATKSDAQKYLGYGSSQSQTSLSYGLYKNSNARITCGFDGYVNTKGRHEGIDVNCALKAPVYSLTDGVITNVSFGAVGRDGLSTIAIYNSASNKTVIYLHTAPESTLRVGQTIKKGDKIAIESWRGISEPSGRHTHVEVRNGRVQKAAKSVDDYTLDNSNPTSFWNSMGYSIK